MAENPVVVKEVEKKDETKIDVTEHLLSMEELSTKCDVKFDTQKPSASAGLSLEESKKRLAQYGQNRLSPPKKVHPLLQFIHYMFHIFNVMLWMSGIAAYIAYAIQPAGNSQNIYLGAIFIFVAFANAGIEFYQTAKSQAILESFLNLIPAKCYAIRGGKLEQTDAIDLVYGDVVYIRSGDKIPADLLIFHATDCKVDNSSLTGEAEPQERGVGNKHENPLEAHNLIFNGTLCVNGEAYGLVVRTGDNTVIGQIAFLTSNEDRRESPMNQEINFFVYLIASVAAVVAIVFFIVSMTVKGNDFAPSLNFAIGTFVSFVPEGLPATVTILLTIAAKSMAARNVLVKDLQGVETLGAITLLATDKTGTLTRNQMTVTYIWAGAELFFAMIQAGNDPSASLVDISLPAPNEILHMSLLCSRARFETNEGPISSRPILGDATESGLLRNAAQKLDQYEKLADLYPKVCEVPFNSDNKWAMTIHRKKHANGVFMLYLKGAPERVLRLCSTFHDGKNVVPITEQHKADFDKMYNFMASRGHRVLAFAALALPESEYPSNFEFKKDPVNYPTKELTFYGLVSLEDPPKHGVREAIGHCRAAGIKVMMVTGDHPLTAEAIGRKINLMVQDTKETLAKKRNVPVDQVPEADVNAIVIHGEKVDSLTEADWENIFSKEEIIFARTSPKHKLTIVKHAQSVGHIVGVTGDGVNDSPALKKADLGIAMNISGSDVSKEAAAMILIDDNFASCVRGIEEGRLIFQNLKKSIRYTISHTMPQVWANLLFISVPLPLPLSAILILLSDLGFELFMALSYAWDTSENRTGLMKLPPRKPVTEDSMARLKRIAAEEERGERTWFKRVQEFFTDPSEEDTLVDSDTLSWAYLEAGTIEAIGCLVCYFFAMWYHHGVSPGDAKTYGGDWGDNDITLANGNKLTADEQKDALAVGQSAFYLALMIQQSFNLFICKARLTLPFGRFMFENPKNFLGVLFGAIISFSIVYIPPFNIAFETSWRLTPWVWLIAMGFGVFMFLYSIIRFLIQRARNPIKYSKDVQGLDLHPTRGQPHINRKFTEKMAPCQKPYQYAIVLDAGSTGSRIHIYKFNKCRSTVLEDEVFRTTTPGLSSMAPVEAAHSLDNLMNAALDSVPPSMFYCTPLTLKATAGLRMLPDGQGSKILAEVEKRLKEYPFPLVKNGVEIMAGEQEGIYAWITLNYLLKNIGTGKRLPTSGIMDLGGGSTQIVFEQEDIPAGKHRINLDFGGFSYVLYQHSFDGYGLIQGRKKIHEIALRSGTSSPCLTAKTEILFSSKTILGVADTADKCLKLISTHLFDKSSDTCSLSPCSFDGVYMPKITASHQMHAFSYFFDKFANPFESHSHFKVGQIKAAAHKVCSSSPPVLGIEGMKELEKNLEWCTDLGYIYSLLSVGYDLPDDRVVKSTKKVDGIEIGWSLGSAIQMLDTFDPLCK